ncbi:MAG: ATP-binding protein [Thermodesulfobacteriota bacterium]
MTVRCATICIDADLANVCLLGVAVRGICVHAAFTEVQAHEVQTCVVEAVNNVIIHAYSRGSGKPVEVNLMVHPDRLQIEVCDYGRGMEKLPEGKLEYDPTDLDALPEGGMGIFLIRSIMDSVSYQSIDGKNVLTMVRMLPGECNVPSPQEARRK